MDKEKLDLNFEALFKKGYLLHKKGLLSKALKIYKSALKIDHKSEKLFYYLGYLYSQQGKNLKAVESFKYAIRINPKNYWSYNNLGLALQYLNKVSEAKRAFKKALKLNPDSDVIHFNLARLLAQKEKRFKQSIMELKIAIKLNPINISNYYALGLVYEKNKEVDRAIEAYKKILSFDKKNIVAQEAIKKIKRHKGEALS